MQTFSYGSLAHGSATNGYVLELSVQEDSISTADNTSRVSYTLKLISGSNNCFNMYHIGASVWLNGALVGYRDRLTTAQVSLGYNSSVELLSDTVTIAHNADGSCTMPVVFSLEMETGAYVPGNLYASGYNMTLSYIPRESSISAADADIGAVSMIAVTKQSESFTHSVAYTFGALSGYITADGGVSSAEQIFSATSIPFVVPESFYTQIPDAPSGQCVLTVNTYFGAAVVGSYSSSFTVTANKDVCTPEIAWNITDINETTKALTGNAKSMIRYYSIAHCEIQVTAKNSAKASKAFIGGTQIEMTSWGYGTRNIFGIETDGVAYYGEDSRGYGCSKTITADLVPYIKLTNRAVMKWTDITAGKATLQLSGAYYDGSFGAVDNALHIRYRPVGEQDYTEVSDITLADGRYTAEVALAGLDYQQEYSYEVQVWDALADASQTVILGKGLPVFHWGANDFQFCVPVHMNSKGMRQVYSINGLTCGGIAFDENVTAYLPIRDRTLMLFGLAGNTGDYALYLVMFQTPDTLSQCVRLSGTLRVDFSLESTGVLKIVSPAKWSYGWYIQNSDYADLYNQ